MIGRRLGKNGLLVGMGSPRLIQPASNLQGMNALLEIFNREGVSAITVELSISVLKRIGMAV
jgi:hypothetical protein